MQDRIFRALVVSEHPDGRFIREIKQRKISSLPDHEVLIRVHYSSLNYKDALSATGNKSVTRKFPHTLGIDAAGVIEESGDSHFKKGDKVIVTGYDLGQNTPGGFGQYIRVPADWIVSLPEGLSLRESMIYGTAGFTAACGVYKLQQNKTNPRGGPVLVTGATGGVGSLAVTLLAQNSFEVTAATGKTDRKDYLEKLGASNIIHREEVTASSDKALLSATWNGAIDTVGGAMLDAVIRQTRHNGTVTCCGNILGPHLHTSIYPFILRGISLMGIDSGNCLMPVRKKIWRLLATDWKPDMLKEIATECTLDDLEDEIHAILEGRQTGRIIVHLKN